MASGYGGKIKLVSTCDKKKRACCEYHYCAPLKYFIVVVVVVLFQLLSRHSTAVLTCNRVRERRCYVCSKLGHTVYCCKLLAVGK